MDNQAQERKTIQFTEIKKDLLEELNKRVTLGYLKFPEKVNIVDGFANQMMSGEISNSIVIGGPTVPMIMVVGESTGQIYFFALRALLPKVFN
jgi:hypothetical protein